MEKERKFIFETWIGKSGKHNTLSFNDLVSVLSFTRDFVGEHTRWGEWYNEPEKNNDDILYIRTTGDEKGEFYNLKVHS